MHAVADFCLIPMGVDSIGVTKYIAECQRVLEKTEGIKFKLHGYGTGLEGEFGVVMKAIEDCHRAYVTVSLGWEEGTDEVVGRVHAMGCPRVATDIRIVSYRITRGGIREWD